MKTPLNLEVYESFNDLKNQSDNQVLTDSEALDKALDIMDLYASMEIDKINDLNIDWIDLEITQGDGEFNKK